MKKPKKIKTELTANELTQYAVKWVDIKRKIDGEEIKAQDEA